jgi:hypothetical protein
MLLDRRPFSTILIAFCLSQTKHISCCEDITFNPANILLHCLDQNEFKMKSTVSFTFLIIAASCLGTFAFVPKAHVARTFVNDVRVQMPLNGFMGDKERDGITRDNEPEDFFQT